MKDDILVSTIIPTYKRADKLSRAIDSVLNQTYKKVEVIVVDDNNSDTEYRKKTEKIMKKYEKNKKVKYIRHEKNMNGNVARNTGIKNSSGEYICFLDDDDFFYKNKIEKQVKFLKDNPQYQAVYCARKADDVKFKPTKSGNFIFELISGLNIVDTITIMMKKEALLSFDGWDESFKRNQDIALMMRFFIKGYEIGYLDEILCETDLSDRSNALSPKKNEEIFKYTFNVYKEEIKKCNEKQKNAEKIIYSKRYLGILLYYLKRKYVFDAIRIYFKMTFKYPIIFNKECMLYIKNRYKKIR